MHVSRPGKLLNDMFFIPSRDHVTKHIKNVSDRLFFFSSDNKIKSTDALKGKYPYILEKWIPLQDEGAHSLYFLYVLLIQG